MLPPLEGATSDFSSLPWCRALFELPKWHAVPAASCQKNPKANKENSLMIYCPWNERGVSAVQSFVRVGSKPPGPSETDVGEVLQIFSLGDGMNGIEWDLPRRYY